MKKLDLLNYIPDEVVGLETFWLWYGTGEDSQKVQILHLVKTNTILDVNNTVY